MAASCASTRDLQKRIRGDNSMDYHEADVCSSQSAGGGSAAGGGASGLDEGHTPPQPGVSSGRASVDQRIRDHVLGQSLTVCIASLLAWCDNAITTCIETVTRPSILTSREPSTSLNIQAGL